MPRETKAAKAARLLADRRVRVILANEHGIWAHVDGDTATYRTKLMNTGKRVERYCTCDYSRVHEVTHACSHTEALTLIWRPGA
jgi:uncharacterized Zn finger protein